MKLELNLVDYLVILTYFVFVLGIGYVLKRKMKTSNDFLMSGRSIPMWVASLAFISANLGAQEVLGMAASGAKYGLFTTHFYWLGAAIAMVFLGIFMMPFYYGSKARSVPEYLALRYDEKTRGFNAITFAIMTIFSSGISLYALAILLEAMLGWSFSSSIIVASIIVLGYTYLGGLTSAVYNEVLQFFLIVLGIAPLVYIGLHHVGGWEGIKTSLEGTNLLHVWKGMGSAATNPLGTNYGSLIFGLGFVLAFGYWCTDFLVVQRAMVTKNINDAQMTPIYAAIPKIFMPVIVILPGIIALVLMKTDASYTLPMAKGGGYDYNMTLPSLLQHFYPNGLLGVGLTALIASFMSGMAGNVTAFNTVFTFDIYQSYIKKGASDKHYLNVGKAVTVFGIAASVATAYLARSFDNIMDFLQLVFGFINAPLFATFFLGMFWKKATANGAFYGLISGTLAAAATHGLTVAEGKGGWLSHLLGTQPLYEYGSSMGQNFNIASVAFISCFLVTWLVSLGTKRRKESELVGLVYSLTEKQNTGHYVWYKSPVIVGSLVVIATIIFNIIFY
ncbi:sodium:solute symporter family protein [Arachidicoccus terrestris]|uniref:sodium:solute symporter family protein n=1 Tax=Arachidicoccus terrestris TaxID=2875539 RepID=UPI001CC3D045|nr:sodium:solute symporter family protein [Arachidicoccus terrestris]UAY54488.1 sodium:solute symporter family protein [Arachidicoccus terrestris]